MESSSIVELALTERVGWTVGVAIVVLVVLGRVKPVRAKRPLARRAWEKLPGVRPRQMPRLEVQELPVTLYRRPRWWERGLALVGSGLVTVVMGAMLAITVAAGAIWAVDVLTSRLK